MENETLSQNELTSPAGSPRLEGGDIFMADTGGEEGRAPRPDAAGGGAGAEGTAPPPPPEAAAGAGGAEGTPPPPETPPPADAGGDGGYGDGRPNSAEGYKRLYETNPEKFWKYLRAESPHVGGLDTNLLDFITDVSLLGEDKPLDYLVNKLISLPLKQENTDYQLGLTAGQNLEHIKSVLKEKADRSSDVRQAARYQKVITISETVALFHRMNMYIVTGNLDAFGQQAPLITPEQQQALKRVKGVATIMRLIDNEYLRILVEKDIISTEESDKMHGKMREAGGASEEAIGTVARQLRDLVGGEGRAADGINSVLRAGELAGLEPWEIDWAFNAGKLLQNIGLRSAELISLSTVPKGERAWSSIPQEHAARIMNQIGWNMKRFTMGEARGGFEFVKTAQQHFQNLRERQGYKTTGLSKIAGKEIEDFEIAAMFKAAGIYTSWRNTNMIIDKMGMVMPAALPEGLTPADIKIKTVGEYIKAVKAARDARLKHEVAASRRFGREGDKRFTRELEKRKTLSEPERLKATYLENGELRKEFTSAYGILARCNDLAPDQKDAQISGLVDTKAEIREAIWRRAAIENPMGVANLMVGMDFKRGQEPHFHHGGIDQFRTFTQSLKTEENPTWKSLRQKLIAANELRLNKIKRINKGEAPSSVELSTFLGAGDGQVEITTDEKALLREVQAYGKDIAEQMAAVRMPFNPFMNDVIFEDIDYAALGSSYYMRRTGDLGATMQCYENMQKIVMDPARISKEDAFKAMQAMVDAMAGPNSTATAQDETLPFLMAMLDMWEAGAQHPDIIRKWLAKDNLYRVYAKALKIPNSIAQKYGGVEAIAYDEFGMMDALNEALHMGITRTGNVKGDDGFVKFVDIDSFLRKKHKVRLGGIIMAILRDLFPVFAMAAIVEGGKQSTKEVKA